MVLFSPSGKFCSIAGLERAPGCTLTRDPRSTRRDIGMISQQLILVNRLPPKQCTEWRPLGRIPNWWGSLGFFSRTSSWRPCGRSIVSASPRRRQRASISLSLYPFESNVRSAELLGLVDAGGIGQVLFEPNRGFYYAEAAVLIVIVLTATIVDLVSQRLRKLVI